MCLSFWKKLLLPKLEFYSCTRESILQKCKKDLTFAAQWVKDGSGWCAYR